MILTAHQSVYLPWLGLFHKIALADAFLYLDTVQYQKNEWNNANKIKTAHGPLWLTVPVLTKDRFGQRLCDAEIDNRQDWRRKHWRSFAMNYAKAPFWNRYAPFLHDLYGQEWTHLSPLNEAMLRFLLDALGLKPKLYVAREMNLEGAKSDLVLDMCRKTGATTFIFGALGRDYAQVEDFHRAGIEVVFQDYRHPVYPQAWGRFRSYLTAFDLLFHCGDDSLDILMSGNIARRELAAHCELRLAA